MVEGLRQIQSPTLVLLGEFDIVSLGPSNVFTREIPGARHVILDGIGHMTAIEDAARTGSRDLGFRGRLANEPCAANRRLADKSLLRNATAIPKKIRHLAFRDRYHLELLRKEVLL